MIVKISDTNKVKNLFKNSSKTFVLSALQQIMGEVFADDLENPKSAIAILGDFYFPVGIPNDEILNICDEKDFKIIIPQNREWEIFIEKTYGEKARKFIRYAVKNTIENFDKEKLNEIVSSLSKEYELKNIDEKIFNLCLSENWSKDLVSNFKNYEMFKTLGIGVVILKNNEIVSGASSYLRYDKGIEIEIDTREDYQKKGLACICGAKIILECLKNSFYPSWDAHTKISMRLAEKLGYKLDCEYIAYEIRKNQDF